MTPAIRPELRSEIAGHSRLDADLQNHANRNMLGSLHYSGVTITQTCSGAAICPRVSKFIATFTQNGHHSVRLSEKPDLSSTTTVIWPIRNKLDEDRTHVLHSAPNLIVVKECIRPGSMIEVTQFSVF
jgi:hypothetical protein